MANIKYNPYKQGMLLKCKKTKSDLYQITKTRGSMYGTLYYVKPLRDNNTLDLTGWHAPGNLDEYFVRLINHNKIWNELNG